MLWNTQQSESNQVEKAGAEQRRYPEEGLELVHNWLKLEIIHPKEGTI